MSDDDNVFYLPGVEPPCDVEPQDVKMLKAAEHATDVNPNMSGVMPTDYSNGSFGYPCARVVWKVDANGTHLFHRWHIEPDYHVDIPISKKEALQYATTLLRAVTGDL